MMRYAIISDIHANLSALEAVLQDIAARPNIAATYHLGDLVGYAPWPNEVVTRIRDARIPGVAGNYDSTTATDYKHCGCRYENPRQEALSHESYEWTRTQVTPETKTFLGALPFRMDVRPLGGHTASPTVTLLHGNQVMNTVYTTADRTDTFLTKMGQAIGSKVGDVVCVGHTHIPWHCVVDGIHYVNTGSVGRPKDEDWRAGYVLLDIGDDEPATTFVRVEYDIDAAMAAIRASTLPDEFAEYLKTGGITPATLSHDV
jgi:predicted phosphodiesterase